MSTLKATTIEPATGTDITLGTTGDTVALPGNTLALDTWKDSGGNTLFISNGSGTVSSVNSGLKGAGPVLISTSTFSSVSSTAITTGIDNTYEKYIILLFGVRGNTQDATSGWNGSIDGGSNYNVNKTTTMFVNYMNESGASTDLVYDTAADVANGTGDARLFSNFTTDADESYVGWIELWDPSSTTYVKNWTIKAQGMQSNPQSNIQYGSGYFNTTSAIDEIQFKMSADEIQGGSISLYGIT